MAARTISLNSDLEFDDEQKSCPRMPSSDALESHTYSRTAEVEMDLGKDSIAKN